MHIDEIRAIYKGAQIERVAAKLELAARYAAMASVVNDEAQQKHLTVTIAEMCQQVIDKLDRMAL